MSQTNYKAQLKDFQHIEEFIAELFDPQVRSEDSIVSAAKSGKTAYSFAEHESKAAILNAWLAAWQEACGGNYDSGAYSNCPPDDQYIIAWMARYISENQSLNLCVPEITATNKEASGTDQVVYSTSGYTQEPFISNGAWNYGSFDSQADEPAVGEAVARLLYFMYHGAHFVVVSNSSDTSNAGISNFYDSFTSSANSGGVSPTHHDPANSHYTNTFNTSGYYYLNIDNAKPPGNDALILALLTGKTSDISPNSFLQLEGWQAHYWDNAWHMADYDSYKATFWNISTFGACPFSEKRSTPIFLAPSQFDLSLNQDTHMPLYEGAGSVQGWMNPGLLQIPS